MKHVFILIASGLVLVSAVYFSFNHVFKYAPWGIYRKFYQIFEDETYYDVWIIGSSRAETAFETDILSKKTGLKIFNAGIHGAQPQQTYYVLKQIIKKHPLPQLIVFDIDVHNLSDKDTVLNIEQFAPFLSNSYLRKDLSKIDHRISYAYYFPMYGISFYGLRGFSKYIRTLTHLPGRYDTTFQSTGCYHSHTDYQKDHYPDVTHPFQYHPINILYIDSVIDLCKKKKINLIFTASPVYHSDTNTYNAMNRLKNIARLHPILLLDFSYHSSISSHQENFSDKYHLNFKGSIEFTGICYDSLNKHLNVLNIKK